MSHSDQGAIARLAAWLTALRAEDFPQRAIERAKLLLLDTLGCGFAALDDDGARAVLATLDALGEKPQCTVLGHPHGMSAPSAVLANGTLIRVLDLNDYVVGAHPQSGARGGHPSDNIPVALAAAELSAQSRGRDLLAAIVLAYEIYGRGKALMDAGLGVGRHHHFRRGRAGRRRLAAAAARSTSSPMPSRSARRARRRRLRCAKAAFRLRRTLPTR